MLTISKPLSSSQAQTYHAKEFMSAEQNYWKQGDTILGEWQGRMAEQYGLTGGIDAQHFARLSEGQNPHAGLRVYEVDHPATQSWKKELAEASGVVIPESLHFVAVDFETQKLSERLEEAGLDANVPTVFAMLGVVMYLTPDAFGETLKYIAEFPDGSGVIFDYAVPRHMLPAEEIDARDELASRVESIGEPFQLFFGPDEVKDVLGAFESIEDVDDKELNRLYFAGRTDQLNLKGRSGHMIAAFRGSSLVL